MLTFSLRMTQGSRHASRRAAMVTAAVISLAGCDSATGPAVVGVKIVSGDGVRDTALARLSAPLVVQAFDRRGGPARRVEVQFLTDGRIDVAPGGPRFRTYVSTRVDTTDENGLAQVSIVLGTYAGEDTVIVRAPALESEAVARYTVLPGATVGVAVVPADTAVYVDRGFRLRGSTVDRWGNPRGEPVSYTASGEVALSGDSLTGRAIGRAKVTASAGSWTGVGWVSVVPRGTVVAVRPRVSGPDTAQLVLFNLDGSGFRSIDLPYWANPQLDWAPSSGVLVMEDGGTFPGSSGHLVLADSTGPQRRLIESSAGFVAEFDAQYSVDGSWIYFAGAQPGRRAEIWRVRPDGSGAERVGPEGDSYYGDFQPSPSPDGTRVAYARTPSCCYELLIGVLHVATGTVDSLHRSNGTPIAGIHPRWSPTADVIAYNNAGQIWLMQPDGSNERTGSPPGHSYGLFDWSPDGRWLIAESDAGLLFIIEPATGLALPLAFTRFLAHPAWRP